MFGYAEAQPNIYYNLMDNRFTYTLDIYPNAQVAYSFIKLRSAYVGNCIDVKNKRTGSAATIGFINNVVDTNSMKSIAGLDTLLVTKIYDQSGNSNNATQSAANLCPLAMINGLIIYNNKIPSLYFYTNGYMTATYHQLNNYTIFCVATTYSTGTDEAIFETSSTSGSYNDDRDVVFFQNYSYYWLVTQRSRSRSYQQASYSPITQGVLYLNAGSFNGSTITSYVNSVSGTPISTTTLGTSTTAVYMIGAQLQGASNYGSYLNGKISELIVYPSNQNVALISNNINEIFKIY